MGVLREAGFADEDVCTVVNCTAGHTLEERAALVPDDGVPGTADTLRAGVPPESHPHRDATLPTLTDTDFGRLFEYGLGLLIGGLRARH
ncbi:TetR/AcrR family transcriptional regulator C-terminal domain-containing protein [Streptomyces hygroscopicus]|uniref:TetR/AcrR family transcriptional regulator C-terminal domain-containing protein n=1 Tax=Streptomyces hygroscopicus TaxID=1912 RepID=UPI000A93D2C6